MICCVHPYHNMVFIHASLPLFVLRMQSTTFCLDRTWNRVLRGGTSSSMHSSQATCMAQGEQHTATDTSNPPPHPTPPHSPRCGCTTTPPPPLPLPVGSKAAVAAVKDKGMICVLDIDMQVGGASAKLQHTHKHPCTDIHMCTHV